MFYILLFFPVHTVAHTFISNVVALISFDYQRRGPSVYGYARWSSSPGPPFFPSDAERSLIIVWF